MSKLLQNGGHVMGGTVANLTDVGYDVIDSKGNTVAHITTGPVECDLGLCQHTEHQIED
jgi:hypothetical protein